MGDRSGMSISADSPSDETLNRGPLVLLLRWQYEFPFGINIVQFSFFSNFFTNFLQGLIQCNFQFLIFTELYTLVSCIYRYTEGDFHHLKYAKITALPRQISLAVGPTFNQQSSSAPPSSRRVPLLGKTKQRQPHNISSRNFYLHSFCKPICPMVSANSS